MSAEAGQPDRGAGWGILAVTRYPDDRTMHVQQWRLHLPHADEFGRVFRHTLGEPAEEHTVAIVRAGNVSGFRTYVGSAQHDYPPFTDTIALAWVPPSDTGFVQLWYVDPDRAALASDVLSTHVGAPRDEQLIPIGRDDTGKVIPPEVITTPFDDDS